MASEIYILVVEDEPDVLDAIVRDLSEFEEKFPIEMAETAEVARQQVDHIQQEGNRIGLMVCDHILPGDNGVDLLIELHSKEETQPSRKMLITGQAGHDDTIQGLNRGGLQHYIAKPWQPKELKNVARALLTDYVIENERDLLQYLSILDAEKISEVIHRKGGVSDA